MNHPWVDWRVPWVRLGLLAGVTCAGCFGDAGATPQAEQDAGEQRVRVDAGPRDRDAGPGAAMDAGRPDAGPPDAGVDAGLPACLGAFDPGRALFYDVTNDRLLEGGQTRFDGRVTALGTQDALPAPAVSAFEAAGVPADALRWVRIGSQTGADWIVATAGVPLDFGVELGSAVQVRLDQNPLRLANADDMATAEIAVGGERAFFFRNGFFVNGDLTDGVSWLQVDETCRPADDPCARRRFRMELTIDGEVVVLDEGALESVGPYDAWHWMSASVPNFCTGSVPGMSMVAFARATPLFEMPGTACETSAFSTFHGVAFELAPGPCTFSLAQAQAGVAFDYTIEVERNQVNVHPTGPAGFSCPELIAGGLLVADTIEGDGQRYCECDVGLCPSPPSGATIVTEGSYPVSFDWTGHNWTGPSDTNNPLGAAFPPGSYVFRAVSRGVIGSGPGPEFEISVARAFTLN